MLPTYLVKRIERAGGQQPRHGACLICRGSWDDCPHTRTQVDALIVEYERSRSLIDVLGEVR